MTSSQHTWLPSNFCHVLLGCLPWLFFFFKKKLNCASVLHVWSGNIVWFLWLVGIIEAKLKKTFTIGFRGLTPYKQVMFTFSIRKWNMEMHFFHHTIFTHWNNDCIYELEGARHVIFHSVRSPSRDGLITAILSNVSHLYKHKWSPSVITLLSCLNKGLGNLPPWGTLEKGSIKSS